MKRNLFFRTLSFFVMTSFVMTNYSSLPVYGKNISQPAGPAPALPAQTSSVEVPVESGKIEEVFQGTGNKTVILLQDAHSIPDAQRNIQKLIEHFQNRYGVAAVGLEGAASPLDPQIFRSFPDQGKLKKVFEEYLEKGELTGSITASVFSSGRETVFQGIEDWELYEQGTALYLAALQQGAEILSDLRAGQEKLKAEKESAYSKKLLEADTALRHFHENHGSLLETLKTLAKIKAPEKGSELALLLEEMGSEAADPEEIEAEIRRIAERARLDSSVQGFNQKYQEFQTSRISPGDFALFMKESGNIKTISSGLERRIRNQQRLRDLEGAQFFRSFENYARSVKESLFRNSEERKLDRESRELDLFGQLAGLALSRSDWTEIKSLNSETSAFLRGKAGYSLAFYQNAVKREEAFFEHLMNKVMPRDRAGLLVLGGFHTEGLAAKLRQENISYVVVMPRIHSVPENSPYRDQMRGRVSWESHYRVENGKVSVYEAFVREVRDNLLGDGEAPALLRNWRDQIIRDLAEREEIGKARRYTRFLDEAAGPGRPLSGARPAWMEEALKFMDGLKQLKARGELSEQTILNLLKPSAIPPPALNVLGSGDRANGKLIRGEKDALLLAGALENLQPRSEARSEIAGRAFEITVPRTTKGDFEIREPGMPQVLAKLTVKKPDNSFYDQPAININHIGSLSPPALRTAYNFLARLAQEEEAPYFYVSSVINPKVFSLHQKFTRDMEMAFDLNAGDPFTGVSDIVGPSGSREIYVLGLFGVEFDRLRIQQKEGGVLLFDREGRSVPPSESGKYLFEVPSRGLKYEIQIDGDQKISIQNAGAGRIGFGLRYYVPLAEENPRFSYLPHAHLVDPRAGKGTFRITKNNFSFGQRIEVWAEKKADGKMAFDFSPHEFIQDGRSLRLELDDRNFWRLRDAGTGEEVKDHLIHFFDPKLLRGRPVPSPDYAMPSAVVRSEARVVDLFASEAAQREHLRARLNTGIAILSHGGPMDFIAASNGAIGFFQLVHSKENPERLRLFKSIKDSSAVFLALGKKAQTLTAPPAMDARTPASLKKELQKMEAFKAEVLSWSEEIKKTLLSMQELNQGSESSANPQYLKPAMDFAANALSMLSALEAFLLKDMPLESLDLAGWLAGQQWKSKGPSVSVLVKTEEGVPALQMNNALLRIALERIVSNAMRVVSENQELADPDKKVDLRLERDAGKGMARIVLSNPGKLTELQLQELLQVKYDRPVFEKGGVGLPFAALAIRGMGGTIRVENTEESAKPIVRFTIEFPIPLASMDAKERINYFTGLNNIAGEFLAHPEITGTSWMDASKAKQIFKQLQKPGNASIFKENLPLQQSWRELLEKLARIWMPQAGIQEVLSEFVSQQLEAGGLEDGVELLYKNEFIRRNRETLDFILSKRKLLESRFAISGEKYKGAVILSAVTSWIADSIEKDLQMPKRTALSNIGKTLKIMDSLSEVYGQNKSEFPEAFERVVAVLRTHIEKAAADIDARPAKGKSSGLRSEKRSAESFIREWNSADSGQKVKMLKDENILEIQQEEESIPALYDWLMYALHDVNYENRRKVVMINNFKAVQLQMPVGYLLEHLRAPWQDFEKYGLPPALEGEKALEKQAKAIRNKRMALLILLVEKGLERSDLTPQFIETAAVLPSYDAYLLEMQAALRQALEEEAVTWKQEPAPKMDLILREIESGAEGILAQKKEMTFGEVLISEIARSLWDEIILAKSDDPYAWFHRESIGIFLSRIKAPLFRSIADSLAQRIQEEKILRSSPRFEGGVVPAEAPIRSETRQNLMKLNEEILSRMERLHLEAMKMTSTADEKETFESLRTRAQATIKAYVDVGLRQSEQGGFFGLLYWVLGIDSFSLISPQIEKTFQDYQKALNEMTQEIRQEHAKDVETVRPLIERIARLNFRGPVKKILVVEDDKNFREFYREFFSGFPVPGLEVVYAEDGEEAKEFMKGHPGEVDFIITDRAMPKKDGLQLAGEIREELKNSAPLMFASGNTPLTEEELAQFGNASQLHKTKLVSHVLRAVMEAIIARGNEITRLRNVVLQGTSAKILKGTHLSEIMVLEPKYKELNVSLVRPNDDESVVKAKVANEEKALRSTWTRVRQELKTPRELAEAPEIEGFLLGILQLSIRKSLEKSQVVIKKILDDPYYSTKINRTTKAILLNKLIPALEDRDEFLFLDEAVGSLSPEEVRQLIIQGQKDLVMTKLHDVILNLPYGFNTKVKDVIIHERGLSFYRKQEFEKEIPLILQDIDEGASPQKALRNSIGRAEEKLAAHQEEIRGIEEQIESEGRRADLQKKLDHSVHLKEVTDEQISYLEGMKAGFDTYNFMYKLNDNETRKKARIEEEVKQHEKFMELAFADFPLAKNVKGRSEPLLTAEFSDFVNSEIAKGRPMQYAASKFFYYFGKEITDEFWEFLMRYYDLVENGDPSQKKSEKPIIVYGEIWNETDYNRVLGKTRGLGKVVAIVMPKSEGQRRFPHWYVFAKKNGIVVLILEDMKVILPDGTERKLKFSDIHPGDVGMVDGKNGRFVINPDSNTIEQWQKLRETYRYMDLYHSAPVLDETTKTLIPRSLLPATFEGLPVIFWADETDLNVLKGDEKKESVASKSGMKGLGLFRLEEIILDPSRKGIEGDEGRLRLALSEFLNYPPFNKGEPLVMRLFDVAPDKRPHFLVEGIRGPSPRWNLEEVMKNFTGVRFYLSKDEEYREFREFGKRQLKAIFGAHLQKNIEKSGAKILFSDVRFASEVDGIEALIQEAKEEFLVEVGYNQALAESLSSQDGEVIQKAIDSIPVGYMFEDTIAVEKEREKIFRAIARVRELRPAERFIGIGSNDLSKSITQERMVGEPRLDALNPLLIRDIHRIAVSAKKYGIHVTLEGEWGSSPAMLLALLMMRKAEGLEVTPVAATAQIPELLDMVRVLRWEDLSQSLTDPQTKRPLTPLTDLVLPVLRFSLKSFLYEDLFEFFQNIISYPGLPGVLRDFFKQIQAWVRPEKWMPMAELNKTANLLLDILQERITGSKEFEDFIVKQEEAKEQTAEKPEEPVPAAVPVQAGESHRSFQELPGGAVLATAYYKIGGLIGFHSLPSTLIFKQIKREKWSIQPVLYSLKEGRVGEYKMNDISQLMAAGVKGVATRVEVEGPENEVRAFLDFIETVRDISVDAEDGEIMPLMLDPDPAQTLRRSEVRAVEFEDVLEDTKEEMQRSELRLAEDTRIVAGLFGKLKIKKEALTPEEERLLSSSVYAILTKTEFENFSQMFIDDLGRIHADGENDDLVNYGRKAQALALDLFKAFMTRFGTDLERGVIIAVHASGEANDAPYHQEALQKLSQFIDSFIVNGTVSPEFHKALADAGIQNKIRPEKNLDRITLDSGIQAVLPLIMGETRFAQVLKNPVLPVGIASEDYSPDDLTHYDAKFAVLLEYLISISAAMTLEAKDFEVLRRVPADGKPLEESLKLQVAEIREKVMGWLERFNPGLAGSVNFGGGQASIMMKQMRAFIQMARSEARIQQSA